MVLGEWQGLVQRLDAQTPVIFRLQGDQPLSPDGYCEGLSVTPSRMWDRKQGWQPCLLVELGDAF